MSEQREPPAFVVLHRCNKRKHSEPLRESWRLWAALGSVELRSEQCG
jgi:hypothetical protein